MSAFFTALFLAVLGCGFLIGFTTARLLDFFGIGRDVWERIDARYAKVIERLRLEHEVAVATILGDVRAEYIAALRERIATLKSEIVTLKNEPVNAGKEGQ